MRLRLLEPPPDTIVRRHLTSGRRAALSTAFGPSGVVLLHLLQRAGIEVPVYFLDTGLHFPETLQVLRRWRDRGIAVQIVTPGLSARAEAEAEGLWRTDPDRCCALRKVAPNHRFLQGFDVWITALRRDQHASRANTPIHQRVTLPGGHTLDKIAPLATWSRRQIWDEIHRHALPYNTLHDRGYPSVGCTHCTVAVAPGAGERAGRWVRHAKTECGLHHEPTEHP